MNKIVDIFLIILIFFIIYFLQSNFFIWFNIAGVMPNLFILLIMLVGLFMKRKWGFAFGIIFGLLIDIFIGIKIGINAIALGIIGLASSYLDKNFSKDNRLTVMFMSALLTITCEVIVCMLQIIFLRSNSTSFEYIKDYIIRGSI